MKIVVYGLAITSSWANDHASTYRSLCKALAQRGHTIHFVEKDLEGYRNHRDLPRPEFCTVHHYVDWHESAHHLLRLSRDADVMVIGSYFPDAIAITAGLFDAGRERVLFYDIDTPVTVARLRDHGRAAYLDPAHIPHYAAYLSFTGGPLLRELEEKFGARRAVPFYRSVDPELLRLTPICAEYTCEMSYMGTFAADRQPKLMRLLNEPAKVLPKARFLVAGAQYPKDVAWAPNVARIIHLNPSEHAAFYSSSRFTLHLTDDSMIAAGYSPSVRLFEASACGAAILSDRWEGLDYFLAPGREVLLPKDEYEVADIIRNFPDDERRRMGLNARERILAQHTASQRAVEFEEMVSACGNAEMHRHIAQSGGKFTASSAPAQRAPGRPVPLSSR